MQTVVPFRAKYDKLGALHIQAL